MECGNRKKSDVVITMIKNNTDQNTIFIQSKYDELFGESIRNKVEQFIAQKKFSGLTITVEDYGAWDYTLQARLEACLDGLAGEENDT
jgi:citrate lyase gamma subunit